MKKFFKKLYDYSKQEDKQTHFIVGVAISGFATIFMLTITGIVLKCPVNYSLFISLSIGLLCSFLAGLLKEIFDSFGYGTVDIYDALFTAFGGIVFTIMILLIRLIAVIVH